jgi:HK97 gp10 family phage protein
MRIDVEVELNLKIDEVTKAVKDAARSSMRDTVVAIAADTVAGSPKKTGNNMRSIKYEVSGMGSNEMVDPNKIEGAIYSTSGYGGYLETGTYKMGARPYFRPALDRNIHKLVEGIRARLA